MLTWPWLSELAFLIHLPLHVCIFCVRSCLWNTSVWIWWLLSAFFSISNQGRQADLRFVFYCAENFESPRSPLHSVFFFFTCFHPSFSFALDDIVPTGDLVTQIPTVSVLCYTLQWRHEIKHTLPLIGYPLCTYSCKHRNTSWQYLYTHTHTTIPLSIHRI